MIKLLFLEVSFSLCYSGSLLNIFLLANILLLPPFLMKGFSSYIISSKLFPSSTYLSSNLALQYMSY